MPNLVNINWEEYHKKFPVHYFLGNNVDEAIERALEEARTHHRILDVGGGTIGTLKLRDAKKTSRIFALDPNVTPPKWEEAINWVGVLYSRYDLIVAKNSINYLKLEEISELASALVPGGILLFNSFLQPTEMSRPFTNRKGEKGTETSIFEPETGTMLHTLLFDSGEKISNRFYYHKEKDLRSALMRGCENGRLAAEYYKTNSIILKLTKPYSTPKSQPQAL